MTMRYAFGPVIFDKNICLLYLKKKNPKRIRCKLCVFLIFSGTSNRRDGEEGRRSRITSCLEPVLPVPLFLYNSGEYFYLLFSKGSFFSSLIVETHFLWKLQCVSRGISSHPTFLHPEQLLSVSSSFQSGKELRHWCAHTQTHCAWRLQRQSDNLPKWLTFHWLNEGFFCCCCCCLNVCNLLCMRAWRGGVRITHRFLVYNEADYLERL